MKRNLLSVIILLALVVSVCATAETITVYGTVVSVESESIVCQVKGSVIKINAQAGDRVEKNTTLVEMETTKIYAPVSGQIQVWASASNSITELTEKYGAIAYIIPTDTYSLKATPENANGKRIKVHSGQKVFLRCNKDGRHSGQGIVTKVEEKEYTVQVDQGNFVSKELVDIFTQEDYSLASRIGQAKITTSDDVAITGTGYVVRCHVNSGDKINKGDLLFETIEGNVLSGAMDADRILCPNTGVLASLSITLGENIENSKTIAEIYPDDTLRVKALVPEGALSEIHLQDTVYISSQYQETSGELIPGIVEKISSIPEKSDSAELSYESFYAVYIIVPDASALRYGMNVTVTNQIPEPNT